MRNGAKVEPDITHKMLESENVHTLLILEVHAEDAGTYECVAVNEAGECRCTAKVEVSAAATPLSPIEKAAASAAPPPLVVEPLMPISVPEGQPATFKTKVANSAGTL